MKALWVMSLLAAIIFLPESWTQKLISPWERGFSDQYKSENNLGMYAFGYNEDHTTGGSFRRETGDHLGNKVGSYGLRVADGRVRIVNYVADEHGYRAEIESNEPGVISQRSSRHATVEKKSIHGVVIPGFGYSQQAPHVVLQSFDVPISPSDHVDQNELGDFGFADGSVIDGNKLRHPHEGSREDTNYSPAMTEFQPLHHQEGPQIPAEDDDSNSKSVIEIDQTGYTNEAPQFVEDGGFEHRSVPASDESLNFQQGSQTSPDSYESSDRSVARNVSSGYQVQDIIDPVDRQLSHQDFDEKTNVNALPLQPHDIKEKSLVSQDFKFGNRRKI